MKTNKTTSSARTNSSANNKPAGSKPLGNLTDDTRTVDSKLLGLIQGNLGKGAKPAPSSAKPSTKRYI